MTKMTITKNFHDLIQKRAAMDPAFCCGLLAEAIDAMLSGEPEVAKIMLREYINATITFAVLAEEMKRPAESIQRMFAPKGNLRLREISAIMKILQQKANTKIRLQCRDNKKTNKVDNTGNNDELRPEYDLSKLGKGVKGKYAAKPQKGVKLTGCEIEAVHGSGKLETLRDLADRVHQLKGKSAEGQKPPKPKGAKK